MLTSSIIQTSKNMVFFSTCACVNYFSKALERWVLKTVIIVTCQFDSLAV